MMIAGEIGKRGKYDAGARTMAALFIFARIIAKP